MSALLDEEYLAWLYSKVSSVRLKNPERTYWLLLREMFTTEFVWFIPNDDNRIEDGRDLRFEFFKENGIEEENWEWDWMALGCSMLEMLVGLSRRYSFEADGDPRERFWELVENLDLGYYTDSFCQTYSYREIVRDSLEKVVWRTYQPDGTGGLFPLKHPTEDQRHVEIRYQLNAYILERL